MPELRTAAADSDAFETVDDAVLDRLLPLRAHSEYSSKLSPEIRALVTAAKAIHDKFTLTVVQDTDRPYRGGC